MKKFGVLLACLAVVIGIQIRKHAAQEQQDIQSRDVQTRDIQAASYSDPRTVYPHSVVAGGVESAADVKAAIDSDATVAAHYASINVAKLTPVKQTGDVHRYVSYRKNGTIYWTSKPVTIKDGEPLLTDGSTTLRGRCGNMISETPRQPTQASAEEPSTDEMDDPIQLGYVPQMPFGDAPAVQDEFPGSAPDLMAGSAAWTPVDSGWTPAAPAGFLSKESAPPLPSISQLSGPPPSGGAGAPNIPGAPVPPIRSFSKEPAALGTTEVASTPEPSTILMVGLGLACLLVSRRLKARA